VRLKPRRWGKRSGLPAPTPRLTWVLMSVPWIRRNRRGLIRTGWAWWLYNGGQVDRLFENLQAWLLLVWTVHRYYPRLSLESVLAGWRWHHYNRAARRRLRASARRYPWAQGAYAAITPPSGGPVTYPPGSVVTEYWGAPVILPVDAGGNWVFPVNVRFGGPAPYIDVSAPSTTVGGVSYTLGASAATANNTAAVQNGITAAAAINGGLFFPALFNCTGQLTQPASTSVHYMGMSRNSTGLQYTGVTQQPFLITPGQNQGTTFEHICLCGFPADPVVQVLSSTGTGTNGYNSQHHWYDAQVGLRYTSGANVAAPTLAYRGMQVQCDVFRMLNVDAGGRNVALQFDGGTSDWWLVNGNSTVNPQGGEPTQQGLLCTTGANPFTGSGHLLNWLYSGAGSGTTALVGRSVVDVFSCHCESSHLPLNPVACKFTLLGGTHNGDASSTTICSASGGSSGTFAPGNVSKTAATTSFFTSTASAGGWIFIMPDAAAIPGGLPATPIVCDWIQSWVFPGVFPNPTGFTSIAAPAMSTAQTAALASIYAPFAPNDGNKHFYRVSFQVTITTLGSGSFNARVAYTDSNGTARTLIVPMTNTAGTISITMAAADSFVGETVICVNPNTQITASTAGTFTGCTYNAAAQLQEVA
jgi:hypothetical protein